MIRARSEKWLPPRIRSAIERAPKRVDERRHRRVGRGERLCLGAQRPRHTGSRFSAKARMPSRKSSEEKQERRSSTSSSS